MNVIDFFCGCGGASEGLRQAGFTIALGLDIDKEAASTYRTNFPEAAFIEKDITKVPVQDVSEALGDQENREPLLLAACAPCQPFSSQNKYKSFNDVRRTLLDETHRFIRELQPEYIMIENVPGMQNVDENADGPFKRFIHFLSELEYECISFIANSEKYGVPQKRKRLVLLASRIGILEKPRETHGEGLRPYATVRNYIEGIPVIGAGCIYENDPVHRTAEIKEINRTRIQHTPEGGDRRNWPEHLINKCHKGYSGHTDTYGRMRWDDLAPTLTTKCHSYSNGRFGHPDTNQNRAISIREAALLQTFPENYQFNGALGSMARQVGNAVPCLLARCFGNSILEHFYNHHQE